MVAPGVAFMKGEALARHRVGSEQVQVKQEGCSGLEMRSKTVNALGVYSQQ